MQAAESFGCNFSVCGACGLATVNTENGNCCSCNSTNFGWENDNASSQLVGGLFSQGSADVLLLMLNSGHNSALQLHNNGQISPPTDAPAPDFSSAPEEFSPPRKRQCVCQLEGDYYSRAPVPGKRATSASDPQSIYARQRREKINERLKVLQSLVPNGNKVDISTMLEQAIHYVKFLQLQIKLLRSDELWMHAPISYDIVREVLEESKGC